MTKLTRHQVIALTPGIIAVIMTLFAEFCIGDIQLYVDVKVAAVGLLCVTLLLAMFYYYETNRNRIMDLRLEVEELMEDVNALKKSQKSQNP